MSLFEFVTVMVSMILALCLGQLLRNASFLARTDRKIIFYLPYVLWSLALLLTVINHWWSLWDFRDVDWHYGSFLYILIAPILITFATGLFSPIQSDSGPIDLQAHYLRTRRMFSAVFAAYVSVMWLDGPLFTEQAVFGVVGMLHIPIISAALVPSVSASPRANSISASTVIATLLIIMVARYSAI
ncbi:MAG: hypothetical protein GXP15_14380 [Gammaproteobacteria bacterium]|nr:hypothetical protein [Gammaproteobacteria bacterium]